MRKFCRPFEPLSPSERRASLVSTLDHRAPGLPVWLFAYGSLMWDDSVPNVAMSPARLAGWQRQFCVWTTLARGSLENPGLALALVPGGACVGRAFCLAEDGLEAFLSEIWQREMWTDIYQPAWVELQMDGATVPGLTFTINPKNPQYAKDLDRQGQAEHIAQAAGKRGSCREYLDQTVAEMRRLGIAEPDLLALQASVARLSDMN
jgi:cation transport protein ChaC